MDYNCREMRIFTKRVSLSDYINSRADCHWHDEVEVVYVESGTLSYYVNGTVYIVTEGNALLVNAKRMHYGFSYQGSDAVFSVLLFEPGIICANQNIRGKYFYPFFYESGIDALPLSGKIDWQERMIQEAGYIYRQSRAKTEGFELEIQGAFCRLWLELIRNVKVQGNDGLQQRDKTAALKAMLEYIQEAYREEMSLSDIAAAGNLCRSSCCKIFRENLHTSPKEYLQSYRISQSLEMLADKSLDITAVAYACGFRSLSYFTETFHQLMKMTPSAYRKQLEARRQTSASSPLQR